MPPRRQHSRVSQKETDERLSIAETIAGLANSIEHTAFSHDGVISRQNSYDEAAADFARLPSMVIEELNVSAVLSTNSQSLPLPAHTVSVDGIVDTADYGHVAVPSRKVRSQAGRQRVRVQRQPSVCSANVIHRSQPTSAVHTPGTSDNVVYRQTDHLQAATAGCSVSMPFSGEAVYSAVMVGWNPAILASCPAASIEPISPDELFSPLSALRTVDTGTNSSGVEVLKLPLVLEPTSDGMWQLVPVSVSEAFGARLLPNAGCVVQTVAQQSEQPACSGDRTCSQTLSSSMTQAVVGTGSLVGSQLTTAVDNSQRQLHSLSVLGSRDTVTDTCSSTVTCQELSSSISCSDRLKGKPSVTSLSSNNASSSEDAASGLSIFGSLGTLRNYYKRISPNIIHSTTPDSRMLTSVPYVASVGNYKISCTNSMLPAVSTSVTQVVQPVLSINAVSTARNVDVQTSLNAKPSSVTASVGDADWALRNTSRVLPAVSADYRQISPSHSTNKQLLTESDSNLHRPSLASALFPGGEREQSSVKRSCEFPQQLPLKKRQKVSNDIHCEAQQNGFDHESSGDMDNKQTVDDGDTSVIVSPPDISLSEEVVTHTEYPPSANIGVSGILLCQ